MNKAKYYLLFLITINIFSCKDPCDDKTGGGDPLNTYYVQWEVSTDVLLDAIDVLWEKDSVFFYNEDGSEIPFEWIEDSNGSNISERFFFYRVPDDDLAYSEEVTKTYYLDFHDFSGVDRDTLTIKFRAQTLTCGPRLNPLNFYFNDVLVEERYTGLESKLLLEK